MSRRSSTLGGASKVVLLGGLAFATAFGVLMLSSVVSRGIATGMVVSAIVVFTLGEMWTSAAAWTYSYDLAAPNMHGQYQAVFALGLVGGDVVGSLFASLTAAVGTVGWAAVAVFFVVSCSLVAMATPKAPQFDQRVCSAEPSMGNGGTR
jgi:dipeptide/tripeptide permease